MNAVSIRIITAHVSRLTEFYEHITKINVIQYTPDFAELQTPSATIAIGSTRTLQFFGPKAETALAESRSAIIEFLVDDVDQEFQRLRDFLSTLMIQEPTTMPWGNKSMLFKDPDGNLINFFTPVSEESISKFAGKM